MPNPEISIVIATFNSSKTLPLVLKSIKSQTVDPRLVEVLISDGGSADDTVNISKKYKARVIDNPRTEQNYGKYLGFLAAKGKYVMFLDSDEELGNPKSLNNRIDFFEANKTVKMLVSSGYITPVGFNFVTDYINNYGDPFSYFMYHLPKSINYFIKSIRSRCKIDKEVSKYLVINVADRFDDLIFELTAGGSMFDKKYLLKEHPKAKNNFYLLNHAFYLIAKKHSLLGIMKDDPVIHYSSTTFGNYLKKIEWRISNNIYNHKGIGMTVFSGRETLMKSTHNYKKYLFILYSISLILPVFDALSLVVSRRKISYLFHFPLTIYTAVLIMVHAALKTLGYIPSFKSYGSDKLIP